MIIEKRVFFCSVLDHTKLLMGVIFGTGLLFLEQSKVSAQVLDQFTESKLTCENNIYDKEARATLRSQVRIPGAVITDYKLRAIFAPELINRPMTTRFFPARRSITLDADAKKGVQKDVIVDGFYEFQVAIPLPGGTRRIRARAVYPGYQVNCYPAPGTVPPVVQNPPGSTPPPSSCTRNEYNGYYCPPVAFASPNRLIGSSVGYTEPQATDAVGSQTSLELGNWEGTQWG
jgi:hypothetical protein